MVSGGGGGHGGVYFAVDPNQGTFGSGWDEFEILYGVFYSPDETARQGNPDLWGLLSSNLLVNDPGSNNPPQVPHTCQQNRILNAVPGSTLTNPNDTVGISVGGHNQFGMNVTTAQLIAAHFTPFNPFGVADGYHNGNVFFQVHDNGKGGLITEGHVDTFNPASCLLGLIGHSIWDFGIGTLLQHLFSKSHGLLDPGC